MQPAEYYCPWCKWSGPKAQEERYSEDRGHQRIEGLRYLCPKCQRDVFNPGERPTLIGMNPRPTKRRDRGHDPPEV